MRRLARLCAGATLLAVLLLAATAGHADTKKRRELTTREACWYLGLRFAGTGMQRLAAKSFARADVLASYLRLKRVTRMDLKDFPRLTGNRALDGPRLGTFLRTARPKLARILAGKYDASHGALFRLAVDAQLLAVGYEPGHWVSRETLTDMRAAMPLARLPAPLLQPIIRLVDTKRPRHEAPAILAVFADEVSDRLAREQGVKARGALHPSDPPRDLDIWHLGAYAAHAFLLHVQGQPRVELTEALAKVAKRLDATPPRFPERDPKDFRKTVRTAYDYLTGTWAPPIAYRWEYRYGLRERALFAIPLQAISLRLDYAPGAAWVKEKSQFLTRHARYGGLPAKLMQPLTKLLDEGAPVSKVHRAIADLLVDGETHYKKQTPAAGKSTR